MASLALRLRVSALIIQTAVGVTRLLFSSKIFEFSNVGDSP